jgi:hypothetical protein
VEELAMFRALRFQNKLLEVESIKDPVDRILAVTSWFLTCMERMEQMSKKPTNPILGEELTAWVDSERGPTLFRAEQVSHHPPITALVMRNEEKKVQFSSNVKFGITFHGNSGKDLYACVCCYCDGFVNVFFFFFFFFFLYFLFFFLLLLFFFIFFFFYFLILCH